MAMTLPYAYTLALLLVVAAVQANPEPGPSIEAINATCQTSSYSLPCNKLLLENLDVRTPQVKDVIGMSLQVVAKQAAEADAFAKAIKKPSKCVTDCLHDLVMITKHIETLPATLETAKDAGFFEQFNGKDRCGGDCCEDNSSEETCKAYVKIKHVVFALRVTDDLLKRRAYFRKQQQQENNTTSPNSN